MARNAIQFSVSFMICSAPLHQPIGVAHLYSSPITCKLKSSVTPYRFHSSHLQVQKDDDKNNWTCKKLKLNLIGWQVIKPLHSAIQEIPCLLLSLSTTGSHPEPDESSTRRYNIFLYNKFQYHAPIYIHSKESKYVELGLWGLGRNSFLNNVRFLFPGYWIRFALLDCSQP